MALLIFGAGFLFLGLGKARLIDWDENIYAEASRQMIERGDYLNVVINNHQFAEKPPFFFWEQVLSFRIFGVNEFAARLPSAVAGILMILLCFHIGKKIGSTRTGLIWGTIYLTCLLPSSFSRAAVIDYTFNLLIAGGGFFLFFFDDEFRQLLKNKTQSDSRKMPLTHLVYLSLASICMGVAVLTKGPLGGVIPLVGFIGYKCFYHQPRIQIRHFLYCGTLSLTIAFSWYMVNGILHGASFIEGFWRFQMALFSKTLEGHTGPFFYHFVVALAGLLPWTPFLLLFRPGQTYKQNVRFRPLVIFGTTWTIFVLVLMSFVSTKLPHYSASVYIPLSFVVAITILRYLETKEGFPLWVLILYLISTVGMAVLVMMIPSQASQFIQEQGIKLRLYWSPLIPYAGILLICLGLAGFILFKLNQIKSGIIITALFMLIFTQSLWRFLMPPFLGYIQQPLLELVDTAHGKGGKVVFYRLVSFAALFYGKQPIEMLHTYKFPGDPKILNKRHQHDLFVILDRNNKDRLEKEHPLVSHLEDRGIFSMYILRGR